MDGVPIRFVRLLGFVACAIALQAGAASSSDCGVPVTTLHAHGPGDGGWVGHTEQELHASLGAPSFSLGKPYRMVGGPDYEIDVYTEPQPATAGCIDAYKHDTCGVITAYYCR